MKSKKFANVNCKVCVACGECAYACPKGAITIRNGCYASVDQEICVGCGMCQRKCPAGCITLMERQVG